MSFRRITVRADQMGGTPCVRGMRFQWLPWSAWWPMGMSESEILAAYPYLETEDVREAIRYAAGAVRERELPLAASGRGSSSTTRFLPPPRSDRMFLDTSLEISSSAVNSGRQMVEMERLEIVDVSAETLKQLRELYAGAYYDSHMYESLIADIEQKPAVFHLFIARLPGQSAIVGAIVIESKAHPSIDYRGFAPVHSKRFCVQPLLRGKGTGKLLLAESRRYCFEELGLKVIFGISNELGALALHGREGALYSLKSIESYSPRNSAGENVGFFRELLTSPGFRGYRIPIGEGVQIIYCRDAETTALFEGHGYVSREQLLALA